MDLMNTTLLQKAAHIRLVVFDVDGVLTNGSIFYSSNGEEIKPFNTQDGLGIKLLSKCDIATAIITARCSTIVIRRAEELKISNIIQGREDKLTALDELLKTLSITYEQTAYLGDDLPDLPIICRAGLGIAVANAVPQLKEHADGVTYANGGYGAGRELCDFILTAQNKWDEIIKAYI